jgi:hypothetical protein
VVARCVTARDVRRFIMRRFGVLLSLVVVVLLGTLAFGAQPPAIAQEATPAAEEFIPEGISFEPLAYAPGITLPATGDLSIGRISFEPGTGFPIEEGDPSYALAVIESGELTVLQEGPLMVTRAGALEAALGEEAAGGVATPATEEIAAGQEVTLAAGDTVLFPPNVGGGEVRNDGQERTVALVVFVGPPAEMMGEATPAP